MPYSPSKRRSFQLAKWPSSCPELVVKLNGMFARTIDGPFTFDQLRTLEALRLLVDQLRRCKEPFLIFALLWCKLDFAAKANDDETSVDCARGYACEIAAMRLLRRLNSQEILTALTNDYKATKDNITSTRIEDNETPSAHPSHAVVADVQTPLLRVDSQSSPSKVTDRRRASYGQDLEHADRERIGGDSFTALEVAIVAEAKHFTSAAIVQDVLTEIWSGDIIFWSEITEHEVKKAAYYDKDVDARFWNFARLRVPQYAFIIESFNFFVLAALYLLVVVDREYQNLGWIEVILALWFLGFTYQEYDQFREAGTVGFYLANPFNYFDLGMIIVAFAWMVLRAIGIAKQDPSIVGSSYDVLSLQGILLVPRLFSFLTLSPYFGTLFPCLRKLTADFLKFLILIVALYAGFLVTFSILGRNMYSITEVAWLLIRVFFGGSGMGFDAMKTLHPQLGAPVMIAFVTFSQILLSTALISILSNLVSLVMNNARSEYRFLFATTCLESSKSDHMVILSPPFNLIALILVRPLRLILPSNHVILRTLKIWVLRITHAPYVLVFSLYERSPFAPKMSDAHRRRLEKDASHIPMTVPRPLSGIHRPGSGVLGPAGIINAIGQDSRPEDDTDDEEGLDTGVMISDVDGGLDSITKARLESMEQQIEEMKRLLTLLVKQSDQKDVKTAL